MLTCDLIPLCSGYGWIYEAKVSFILTLACWILYLFLFQVNHVTLSTNATYTPVKRNLLTSIRNGRNQGYCLRTKVKTSIEADILANDSTTSESVEDNSGKTSYILLSFSGEIYSKRQRWSHSTESFHAHTWLCCTPTYIKLKLHSSKLYIFLIVVCLHIKVLSQFSIYIILMEYEQDTFVPRCFSGTVTER